MYNNNFSNYGSSSFANPNTQGSQSSNSQYQGYQKQYQPIGYVQSFYGKSAVQPNQSYGQVASPESFHTANYRGNQPGQDAYLRSDLVAPAQHQVSSFQSGYSSYTPITNSQYAANQSSQQSYPINQQQYASNQYGSVVQANQPYAQQAIAPNAYHTANYRGNQPGHDAYLRSDSSTPAQQQGFQSGYGRQGIQSFNTGFSQSGQGQQFGYNSSY
ncbi:hypothetical protein [Paenibacillus sp. SYP-B3998]|uniref:hypothetical protein n=1 Tax=Paenibacillus sp. SYP-B3998 TaxID=2678564 RepID=UPI0019673E6C|nr:hypothetical protein [Paenibacillus sp. SYP-B3998]